MQRRSFEVLSYRDDYLWVLIWVSLLSHQKGLWKLSKVRKTESYSPIPSRDISFYVFFFSFCLPFILSHTCFRPSWASVVEAQGVGPIREDLGFILSCILHWWFEFNLLWDACYKAKRFFFFFSFFFPLNSERSLLEMWNHNFWRFGDLKKNVDSCWLKNWEIVKSGKYPS